MGFLDFYGWFYRKDWVKDNRFYRGWKGIEEIEVE